jgi:hypothetical protein
LRGLILTPITLRTALGSETGSLRSFVLNNKFGIHNFLFSEVRWIVQALLFLVNLIDCPNHQAAYG